MVINQLALAHELASQAQVAAIVTAPLQKSVIMQIQPDFMGIPNSLCSKLRDKVVMMLANRTMKVA